LRILLVHPPWLRFFGKCLTSPPIALNSIASYIKRELREVEIDVYNADHIDDANEQIYNSYLFASKHDEYLLRLKNMDDMIWQEVKNVISDFSPDVIGISSMTASYISGLNISKIVKKINPEIAVVFGGKHSTAIPDNVIKNASVDYVVIGEGEETFKDLIINIDSPQNVKGITFKNQNGEVVVTTPREYIADINKLPVPIFKSSINTYGFEKHQKLKTYKWKIVSARGCPFQCIYCASDKLIRYRSPQHVIEEVKYVKRNYGIASFDFQDDSFSINKKRALELCSLLKNENIVWECNTRVDLIDEDLVTQMKQSGCNTVWIGIETGSEKTFDRIMKNITVEMIYQAIALFKKYKLYVCGFFIIGFPWETKEDMEQTLNLINKLPIDNFELNIATPLPGTRMFNALVDEGKINISTENWSRFHQGSPDMNFSQYSNTEWKNMMLDYTYQISKIHRKKLLWRIPKLFYQDPVKTSKRIFNTLQDHIKKKLSY